MIWSSIRRRLKGADSSSSLPDSILAESSRSFSSVKSRSADPLAVCRQSWTVGSIAFGRATSIMPRMAFMGVRSSWLMLARNWLLAALAASAAALACFSTSSASALARAPARWPASRSHKAIFGGETALSAVVELQQSQPFGAGRQGNSATDSYPSPLQRLRVRRLPFGLGRAGQ